MNYIITTMTATIQFAKYQKSALRVNIAEQWERMLLVEKELEEAMSVYMYKCMEHSEASLLAMANFPEIEEAVYADYLVKLYSLMYTRHALLFLQNKLGEAQDVYNELVIKLEDWDKTHYPYMMSVDVADDDDNADYLLLDDIFDDTIYVMKALAPRKKRKYSSNKKNDVYISTNVDKNALL